MRHQGIKPEMLQGLPLSVFSFSAFQLFRNA